MLIEGFYGNTLQDVEFDMCQLEVSITYLKETRSSDANDRRSGHSLQLVSTLSPSGQPSTMACAVAESYPTGGPFKTAYEFFVETAKARYAGAKADAAKPEEDCEGEDKGVDDDKKEEKGPKDYGEEDMVEEEAKIWHALGPYIFLSIVTSTEIFASRPGNSGPFPLNYMDFGTQNILVNDNFDILAVID
jgi:hypothetical protein